MDRAKAMLNRATADRLNKEWGVGAVQSRYRETGNWYATLARFPAALFDAHGYVLFATEGEYTNSRYLRIGKQISVRAGISEMPNYVRRVADLDASGDVDMEAIEGEPRLAHHVRRERNQRIVEQKRADQLTRTGRLRCEACGFDFREQYPGIGEDFCEVHHNRPLAEATGRRGTRAADLAILCSNCHRMIHRVRPLPTLEQFRALTAKRRDEAG